MLKYTEETHCLETIRV